MFSFSMISMWDFYKVEIGTIVSQKEIEPRKQETWQKQEEVYFV